MTSKKSKKFQIIKRNWGYLLIALVIMLVAIFGSKDKLAISDQSMSMDSIIASNYQVTTDQITQFYMVAELANDLNLASANLASINYTTIQLLQQNSQITTPTKSAIIARIATIQPMFPFLFILLL